MMFPIGYFRFVVEVLSILAVGAITIVVMAWFLSIILRVMIAACFNPIWLIGAAQIATLILLMIHHKNTHHEDHP